jgi:hypothetical protein
MAGMLPADLSKISISSIRGLLPDAFSAMSSEQVAALGVEQLTNISQQARNRLSGNLLNGLAGSKDKLRAAVCGVASAVDRECPPVAVDVVMSVANMTDVTLQALRQQFESVDGIAEVRILSALAASELPVMTEASRRLQGTMTNAMVTLRTMYGNTTTSVSSAVERTRAAATQAATMLDGSVRDVVGLDLNLAALVSGATTTTTNAASSTDAGSGDGSSTGSPQTQTDGVSRAPLTAGATVLLVLTQVLMLLGSANFLG